MSILEREPTKCLTCGNPHQLIDEDAGIYREMERMCICCYDKKFKAQYPILYKLEANEIVAFKIANNDTSVDIYEGINGQGYIHLNKQEMEALIQELTELKDKMI